MSTLLKLAERCEQATGDGTRLLIIEACEAILMEHGYDADSNDAMEIVDRLEVLVDAEAYLDAAMTLLDESWFFHVSRFSPGEGGGQAHVYPNRGLGDDYEADAAKPALALCAAALRAHAASGMEARQGGNEVPCEARQPDGNAGTP